MYKGKEVSKYYTTILKPVDEKTKLRRIITDYLCKYATMEQLTAIRKMLIKTE